jgi:hypothetical protein
MRRVLVLLAASLLAASLAASASSRGALRLRPSRSIGVPRLFDGLVADSGRVAAVGPACRIDLWRPGRRTASVVQACRTTPRDWGSGIDEVALAGDRLAWIREESVSHASRVQTDLVVKAGSGKARVVASGYVDQLAGEGTRLFSLRGAGTTLAFGWESQTTDPNGVAGYDERAYRVARATSEPGTGACPAQADLVSNPPPARLCTNTGLYASVVESVFQGRLLVSYFDSHAAIVEPDNSAHDLSIAYNEHRDDLALSGTNVVVVRSGGTTLDVYDSASSARLHSWTIAPAARLGALSINAGFAVFAARGFHLVRLSDGSEQTLLTPAGTTPIAVTLDASGLFVLYRAGGGTRLGFVPLSRL